MSGSGSPQLHKISLSPNPGDIQMRAILCIGLNLVLPYNELSKLTIDNISVDSRNVTMAIEKSSRTARKKEFTSLEYGLETQFLRISIHTDPFIETISWTNTRRPSHEPIFGDIKINKR